MPWYAGEEPFVRVLSSVRYTLPLLASTTARERPACLVRQHDRLGRPPPTRLTVPFQDPPRLDARPAGSCTMHNALQQRTLQQCVPQQPHTRQQWFARHNQDCQGTPLFGPYADEIWKAPGCDSHCTGAMAATPNPPPGSPRPLQPRATCPYSEGVRLVLFLCSPEAGRAVWHYSRLRQAATSSVPWRGLQVALPLALGQKKKPPHPALT